MLMKASNLRINCERELLLPLHTIFSGWPLRGNQVSFSDKDEFCRPGKKGIGICHFKVFNHIHNCWASMGWVLEGN